MSSVSYCLLGSGLLMSMVYTMMAKDDSPLFQEFNRSLLPEQQKLYEKIRQERQELYFRGLGLGMVLAGLYLYTGANRLGGNATNKACIFATIVMATSIFYYVLSPKSAYMSEHLINQTQIHLHQRIHTEMQRRYYSGFLMGLFGYFLLGYVLTQFPQIGNFANNVVDTVGDVVGNAVNTVGNVVGKTVNTVGDAVGDVFDVVQTNLDRIF